MERYLEPVANPRRRVIILGVLLIPVLLSWRIGVVWQLLACLMPVMLTGTYRVSRLTGERFDTQFHLGFVPLKRLQCRLQAVVYLLTIYQSGQGWGTFFLFGPVQWLIGHVFDYLIPSLGGPYEIWLETAKGRQILAWNGYNQQLFEKNLELLRSRTGAEVRLR
ncbi:MAG: hypothetical protein SH850_11795 [Planctomycetaceae bacterium]|nr:hypothetical protein [Planctomycetaceae bacterium]